MTDWKPERENLRTEMGDPYYSTTDTQSRRSIEGPDGIKIMVSGPEGPSRRRPVLITLDGRRVSERFVLEKSRAIAGRDMGADVKVADGEVSRAHAAITWENIDNADEEPRCRVEDLGSTNGTYVNKKVIDEPTLLKDGDIVRVGRTSLGYYVKDERVLKLDQMLMAMALHDALTGLYKRDFFFTELHREFERSRRHQRPLTLALLDIDHFKQVNDTYGHIAGDTVLRECCDLLRLSLREGDICGRYGGEEFAVIFPETSLKGTSDALERIRLSIAKHEIELEDGRKLKITVSAGAAALDAVHRDKMDLVNDADRALYRAKRNGRNRVEVIVRNEEEITQPLPRSGESSSHKNLPPPGDDEESAP